MPSPDQTSGSTTAASRTRNGGSGPPTFVVVVVVLLVLGGGPALAVAGVVAGDQVGMSSKRRCSSQPGRPSLTPPAPGQLPPDGDPPYGNPLVPEQP